MSVGNSKLVARRLAALGLFVFALSMPSTGSSTPPVTMRGIDIPTVLSFYDRARRTDTRLDEESGRSPAPDSKSLEATETIVLDPGHGDDDSGAIGVSGVAEKYLTLQLAYALRDKLQQRFPSLRVVLTRYWDRELGLASRTHLANRIDADLFLSLHYNAAPHDRAVGVETYFLTARESIPGRQQEKGKKIATTSPRVTGLDASEDEEPFGVQGDDLAVIRRDLQRARQHRFSGMFAEIVQRQLASRIDSADRGVKQANFAVLRGALMPAAVVESGFLTHPEEGRRVLTPDHRQKLVDSLVEAIVTFDHVRSRIRSNSPAPDNE